MWTKVKQVLKGIKTRNQDGLFEGVGKALSLVSANDAQGWFSCGYTSWVMPRSLSVRISVDSLLKALASIFWQN
jgi:hypothetical protein